MEEIKSNPILKFNDNQLSNVRKALGYEDVNKLKQDIEQLDDWIKKQDHFRVKDFDKGYLERMLIYNKGSIERTKKRFDKLCTCVHLVPDFLQNFDLKNEFVHLLNVVNICVLPTPSMDNYRVLIANLTGNDDSEFHLIQLYRYLLVFGCYMLNNDYCHGYEMVVDTRNMTIGIVGKINPLVVHKGLSLLVDAMGQRIKKIHAISGSKFYDTVMILFKQGMSPKLRERIIIHSNVESLHEHIPKEQLPKDFWGDERSMKELSDINFKELNSESHKENIKIMENARTDESRRLVCKFNEEYSGMPGSFKVLKIKIWSGVPQGSLLSPLYIVIFINDIGSSFMHNKIFDDMKIFRRVDNVTDATHLNRMT